MTSFLDLTAVIDPDGDGLDNVRVDSCEGRGKVRPELSLGDVGGEVQARGFGAVASDGSTQRRAVLPIMVPNYSPRWFRATSATG